MNLGALFLFYSLEIFCSPNDYTAVNHDIYRTASGENYALPLMGYIGALGGTKAELSFEYEELIYLGVSAEVFLNNRQGITLNNYALNAGVRFNLAADCFLSVGFDYRADLANYRTTAYGSSPRINVKISNRR